MAAAVLIERGGADVPRFAPPVPEVNKLPKKKKVKKPPNAGISTSVRAREITHLDLSSDSRPSQPMSDYIYLTCVDTR